MRSLQRRTLIRVGAGALVLAGCAVATVGGLRSGDLAAQVSLDPGPGPDGAAGAGASGAAGAAPPETGAPAGAPRSFASDAARVAPGGARPQARAGEGAAGEGGDGEASRAPGSSSGVVVLDGFQVPRGAVTGSARGFDPDGPRALALWRVDAGGSTRLAEGFSDADGNLHFPQVAEPGDPLTLVVAPADAPPPSRQTSDPASLARAAPLPPVVAGVMPTAGGVVLHIAAREATGAVLVAAGDGTVLARFTLPALPGAAARVLDVAVTGPFAAGGLLVAQELPDGRRSTFEPVSISASGEGQP
jgi:hypothetical protein